MPPESARVKSLEVNTCGYLIPGGSNPELNSNLAALGPEIRGNERVGVLNPIAEQRPRFPWINDFLYAKRFRGTERRAVLREAILDFTAAGRRIGGRFDLAAIGGLHASFDGQRAPIARWPRVTQVERLRVAVR